MLQTKVDPLKLKRVKEINEKRRTMILNRQSDAFVVIFKWNFRHSKEITQ